MDLDTRIEGRAVVVRVVEDRCAGLWKLIEPHIAAGRRTVILDFTGAAFINSVNIAAVIAARNRAVGLEAEVIVAGLQERVRAIFRVLRLDRIFELELDLPAALARAR